MEETRGLIEVVADPSIGKKLAANVYTHTRQVLDEAVANAIDAISGERGAGALTVSPAKDEVRLIDSGRGIQGKEELKAFINPGTSSKWIGSCREDGTPHLGHFGFGTEGYQLIGHQLHFTSWREGVETVFSADISEGFYPGMRVLYDENSCGPDRSGLSLVWRQLTSRFKKQWNAGAYASDLAWRLPINDAFSFSVNGIPISPKVLPAGAEEFSLDGSVRVGPRFERVSGALYYTEGHHEHHGIHLYVHGRRLMRPKEYLGISLSKEGLRGHIVGIVHADFLEGKIVFNREGILECPEMDDIREHVAASLVTARRHHEHAPKNKPAKTPVARSLERMLTTLPANQRPVQEFRKASERFTSSQTRVPSLEQLLQEARPVLDRLLLPAGIQLYNKTTTFVIDKDKNPISPVRLKDGKLLLSKHHPALSVRTPQEQLFGHLVSGIVDALAYAEATDLADFCRRRAELWHMIPAYNGVQKRPRLSYDIPQELSFSQNILFPFGSLERIDPERDYAIHELSRATGLDANGLVYLYRAITGTKEAFALETARISGSAFRRFAGENRGWRSLYDTISKIDQGKAMDWLQLRKIWSELEEATCPFLTNRRPMGQSPAYMIDTAATIAMGHLLRSSVAELDTYMAGNGAGPTVEQTVSSITARFNSFGNNPVSKNQLTMLGVLNQPDIDAVLAFATHHGLPLHTERQKEKGNTLYSPAYFVQAVQYVRVAPRIAEHIA